jgi:hypothetical protein
MNKPRLNAPSTEFNFYNFENNPTQVFLREQGLWLVKSLEKMQGWLYIRMPLDLKNIIRICRNHTWLSRTYGSKFQQRRIHLSKSLLIKKKKKNNQQNKKIKIKKE